jgi:hypothetical protein
MSGNPAATVLDVGSVQKQLILIRFPLAVRHIIVSSAHQCGSEALHVPPDVAPVSQRGGKPLVLRFCKIYTDP